jgi:predicted phage terminase large subunit-like protein
MEERRRARLTRSTIDGPAALPLLDFVPRITPKYMAPHHLSNVARKLERFREEPFEFVFSVPPRHGKSELVLHWIIWALLRNPGLQIAYITYNHTQARRQAQKCRRMAAAAGLRFVNRSDSEWRLEGGGKVVWEGIQGSLTGQGYDVIIIDDPVKNRAEAESPTMRERAWAFYQNDCVTRLEPGSSFLCIQTRWHEDDLAGRLTKADPEEEWEGLEYINIPAIQNEGVDGAEVALWPERWPLDALHKRRLRVGSYGWASLFQGHPVPRGAQVFQDATYFTELPTEGYRVGQGLDLAYTQKKHSDFSVLVTMMRVLMWVQRPGEQGEHQEEWFYVRHVLRRQVRAPAFKDEVRMRRAMWPAAPCRMYAAGTELGALDFFSKDEVVNGKVVSRGIKLEVLPPRGDKHARALDFAQAWNEGRVLVPDPSLLEQNPDEYDWLPDYLDVLKSFTGVKDAHDDDVDASVAAYDVLAQPPLRYPGAAGPSDQRRV